MTVSTLNKNKIKISLDDSEVLMIFGGYSEINYNSSRSKAALHMLLSEAMPEAEYEDSSEKILVEIKAILNGGCEITVTNLVNRENAKSNAQRQTLFEFFCAEAFFKAIEHLYENRLTRKLKSHVYKMPDSYRLLVVTTGFKTVCETLKEFSDFQSVSAIDTAYTKEYGKLICKNNAIETIGRNFSKGF